jgi:hypothetical protein
MQHEPLLVLMAGICVLQAQWINPIFIRRLSCITDDGQIFPEISGKTGHAETEGATVSPLLHFLLLVSSFVKAATIR